MFKADGQIKCLLEWVCDSYKLGMNQLHEHNFFENSPTKVVMSYSNFTPRKNAYFTFATEDQRLVNFGIRHTVAYIHGLADDFFKTDISVIKHRLVVLLKSHYGGDVEVDHARFINDVLSLHRLGYLPLEYRAIDEGLKVPIGIPLFTVKNTHEDFSWLVNNFETLTSQLFWPMVNTATKIDQFYQQAKHYGELSTPKEVLDFWLPVSVHNFESRGMFGPEHSARAGAASCIPFIGSDTINAITFAAQYYDYNVEKDAPICVSVRASEHADITRLLSEFRYRGITEDTELEVIKKLAQHTTGIFSYVADSENYFRTISEYALAAKEWIINRKDGGNGLPAKWVWRPDSSKKRPLEVICGDPESSCELERKGSLQILWEVFGGVEVDTPAGKMKLINPKVGLIYGEAISQKHQKEIYERMIELGFSVSNLIIGKGSYANLENNTRDLFSMTFKQTFSIAEIDGKRVNLDQQKTPMGDVSKKSAKGLLMVDENFTLHQEVSEETEQTGLLSLLYRNGNMFKQQSFIAIKDLYFKQ
jgi:nicotinamide phosphoribosyltransferase